MDKMSNDIFSNLYNHFILRDLFAKITPGFILLFSFYCSISKYITNNVFTDITLFKAIIILALSWIIGISLQSFGEFTTIITINHYIAKIDNKEKRIKNIDNWISLKNHFLNNASAEKIKFVERMTLIKEASGIFAISLFVSSSLIIASYYNVIFCIDCITKVLIFIITIIIIISLLRMNYVVWKYEIKYMIKFSNYPLC